MTRTTKERVLQEVSFPDHLWLLDPAWERATDSEVMESRLIEEGVFTDDLPQKEKLGRVDIAYRTNAGNACRRRRSKGRVEA